MRHPVSVEILYFLGAHSGRARGFDIVSHIEDAGYWFAFPRAYRALRRLEARGMIVRKEIETPRSTRPVATYYHLAPFQFREPLS